MIRHLHSSTITTEKSFESIKAIQKKINEHQMLLNEVSDRNKNTFFNIFKFFK